MALPKPGQKLRELFARSDKVLSVFGIPNALHAMIMEKAGVEAGFVLLTAFRLGILRCRFQGNE